MVIAKKSLGQHWLTDVKTLEGIVDAAELKPSDTVLEVGPGLGSLTNLLLKLAGRVVAVEKDEILAGLLMGQNIQKLEVVQGDILKFDLGSLPAGYKVVANIPYYLTSNLLRVLSESSNPPGLMVLLVQKEVAQRICAEPGQLSLLGVSVQLYYQATPGIIVPAKFFSPPPKVDSQVITLGRYAKPLFNGLDTGLFFRIVKAGFSAKRKKLRSSLAAGLGISKAEADQLLSRAGISGDLRAQNLSLNEWYLLYQSYKG